MSYCAKHYKMKIHKTPFFKINIKKVKKKYSNLQHSIKTLYRNDIIAFALKANYDIKIIKLLKNLGSYFEISSEYEFNLLQKYNVDTKKIIFGGVIINKKILKKYIKAGIYLITDSINILKELNDFGLEVEVGIRINLDYIKENNIHFYDRYSRFGIECSDIPSIKRFNNIKITCLHAHIPRHDKRPDEYFTITNELCNIIKTFKLSHVKYIDIGGGFKVNKEYWQYVDYAKQVKKALVVNNMENITIIYEPGNSLVLDSTKYITKVIDKKYLHNTQYIYTDGFKEHINHSGRNIINNYKIIRAKNTKKQNKEIDKQIIVGCSCRTNDILTIVEDSNEIQIGDYIEFRELGGYTQNRISNFLIRRPKIYYC
ncbi:hypothetical protein [Campylobacter devanensis]|uniref:hypothetical protein n=1 Tax=Campylobacter devanensis TaxID=3161138 RepID=UPI000A334C9F|nr:hypothetical protein [Campylobacter sp. P155]